MVASRIDQFVADAHVRTRRFLAGQSLPEVTRILALHEGMAADQKLDPRIRELSAVVVEDARAEVQRRTAPAD